MQTQKDHVDAYSFLIARLTVALVTGDANHVDVPARRAWMGLLIGTGIAALTVAGFLLFGLLTQKG